MPSKWWWLAWKVVQVSSSYSHQPQFHGIPAPSVCLNTVSLSPFPSSDPWSPSSSIHPPPALADTRVRLGSAGQGTICAVFSLLWLPPTGCSALLWGSEAPLLSQPTFLKVKGFPRCRNLSSSPALSQGHSLWPNSFVVVVVVLIFFHAWLHGDFLGPSVVWGPLPVFSRYSVRIVLHIDVFLIYLWEKVSFMSYYSAILITP